MGKMFEVFLSIAGPSSAGTKEEVKHRTGAILLYLKAKFWLDKQRNY